MEEVWKWVEGYEGIYEVSNKGGIRSRDRIVSYIGRYGYLKKGITFKFDLKSDNYPTVKLCKEGAKKYCRVHRLVAEAFIENPEQKLCVNHIDGNKKNNHVSNLEWSTHSENNQHAFDTGLKSGVKNNEESKGKQKGVGIYKLTEKDVFFIRENHLRNGGTLKAKELADIYGVKRNTIDGVVAGRSWKHLLERRKERS